MGDDPLPSLADRRAIAALTLDQVIAKARRLRPSFSATPGSLIRPGEAGIALGEHTTGRILGRSRKGHVLYASLEDVVIAVMAPRAGKTTALTAPGILDAPGAVVATSNKPDVWTTTSAAREAKGTVFVFDPQAITHSPRTWWWNPLTLTSTWEEAFRLADHFVSQIRQDSRGEDFRLAKRPLRASVGLDILTDGTQSAPNRVAGQSPSTHINDAVGVRGDRYDPTRARLR
jgi:Type IV secretory system Conjugative DNA transfer